MLNGSRQEHIKRKLNPFKNHHLILKDISKHCSNLLLLDTYCSGQMVEGIALLDKGIAMAQTEAEIAHLIGLKTTAEIQMSASKKFGTEVPLFSVPLAVN